MLTGLRIKNLALVADLTLELQPGYNAITGETGAGKSILIGALNLVLGQRADRTLIRSGADACSVEAVFDVATLEAPLAGFLEENGLEPCEDAHLILKRTFTSSGANRQFINGSPTTLQVLSAVGEWLVDIHGPHEHQSLLHTSRQLLILDAFGALQPLRLRFATLVRSLAQLDSEVAALIIDEKTYRQQLELLRFQVGEISSAKLHEDEEAQLDQEYQRASNAARLLQLSQAALSTLSEEEQSVLASTAALGRTLHDLQRIDGSASPLLTLHDQASETLRELQARLISYADHVDIDPARLHELEERIDLIHSLKRKYGSTLKEVLEFHDQARQKLHALETREEQLARIHSQREKVLREIGSAGQELSTQRRKLIPKLAKAVIRELNDLGFKQSLFEIAVSSRTPGESGPFDSHGLDTVEFQFSPNPGEPVRPLRAIASSGELARVMLALKTVLAAEDEVPVLVFDEVDANVGGETAQTVGIKMRQIAANRQVLCITHLAPVAAAASAHFVVTKETRAGRTISEIQLLERDDRITELARMLGGQSETARKHAEALLATPQPG